MLIGSLLLLITLLKQILQFEALREQLEMAQKNQHWESPFRQHTEVRVPETLASPPFTSEGLLSFRRKH